MRVRTGYDDIDHRLTLLHEALARRDWEYATIHARYLAILTEQTHEEEQDNRIAREGLTP